MADQLLDAVVRLENQIQQQLQQEQVRTADWLAKVRAEQAAVTLNADRDLAAENDEAIVAANQEAQAAAKELLDNEMHYCTRLEEISDDILVEVLKRQLLPSLVNPSG